MTSEECQRSLTLEECHGTLTFMRIGNSTALGGAIYQRRTDLSLTQADVAHQAGVSRQWLIATERGKDTAEIGRVLAVIRVLGLQLELTPSAGSDLDVIIDG